MAQTFADRVAFLASLFDGLAAYGEGFPGPISSASHSGANVYKGQTTIVKHI
jgi:hypothetical protein